MPDYVAETKTKGFQPEILNAQTNGDNTEVCVRLSARDAQTLAQISGDFQTTKANIDAARSKAETETNNMFLDQAKVVWNSSVNIVEGTINMGIDAAMSRGGQDPVYNILPEQAKPHVDFSGTKFDYRSEMMRRDINGKVDGDGIKAGQAIETGVTVLGPIVVGGVFTPKAAPQTLKTLGGLPEETAAVSSTAASEAKQVTGASKWVDEAGNINWPPNDGFAGAPTRTTVKPVTLIDRYGYEGGSFVSPKGVPYAERSLAPGTASKPYHVYEVVKPIEGMGGKAAAWFDEAGGGMQYKLDKTIKELLKDGYIIER